MTTTRVPVSLAHKFCRTPSSLSSFRSCPFHSGRMSRVDDAYSIFWWYVLLGIIFSNKCPYLRTQMTIMMTTGSKRALFLGFCSESVSRNLSIMSFNLAHVISAHWRQTYFRPNKLLPDNVGCNPSHLPTVPRRPFRRAILNILVSCLCLGVPYMFFKRDRLSSSVEEESRLHRITPTLVMGACTCLVVSLNLSAAVLRP